MSSPPSVFLYRCLYRFEFSAIFAAFWRFLCLLCFLRPPSLTTLHHSPHHGAAVDGTTFTGATVFHHFSHFLKVSTREKKIGLLSLLLVVCLFGLHGKYHLLSDCIDGGEGKKDTPLRYYFLGSLGLFRSQANSFRSS